MAPTTKQAWAVRWPEHHEVSYLAASADIACGEPAQPSQIQKSLVAGSHARRTHFRIEGQCVFQSIARFRYKCGRVAKRLLRYREMSLGPFLVAFPCEFFLDTATFYELENVFFQCVVERY